MTRWIKAARDKIAALVDKRPQMRERVRGLYLTANKFSGGILGVVRHAFTNFNLVRGAEASASLAYYALFSIFPILVAVVTIASLFLGQEFAREQLLIAVARFLPVSTELIYENITMILRVRGGVTIVALISLVWSASNVFDKVILNVNRAFPHGHKPNFLKSRLMALLIILSLVVLFLGALGLVTILEVLPIFEFAISGVLITDTRLWSWVRILLPFLLKYLLFMGVYSWVPRGTSVHIRARLIGAGVTAVLWEISTQLLTWTLANGVTNYEILYGSLASIMVLLFWLYLSAYILYFGAHLTNAINHHLHYNRGEARQPIELSSGIGT